MSDMEKTIIPLDDVHEILGTFGIGPGNKEYQRWRRDDGFRRVDLEDVLTESPLVLTVDWREWLPDAIEIIEGQFDLLGISLSAELDDEGNRGQITVDGSITPVKYVPDDEDNFDDVIDSLNGVISGTAHYRKFHSCEGSDSFCYALLSNEDWKSLESKASETVRLLFSSDFRG